MSSPSRRYRIVAPVGKGAFGTVYHAQMVGEGGFTKDVAIKLMNDAPDEDLDAMAGRHRDEARLLGLIRHRAILQVDGLVRLNGTWAVVMEYIDGANVHEVLKAGPVPLSCALEMATEVASALHVAHTAKRPNGEPLGLVHRDIKPSNIQLTTAGEVKVLDFGIARANFDTRESETVGMILGTLTYMSPERLDGIDGPEGDIYALGVVLVETATRRRMKKTSSSRDRHAETVRLAEGYIDEVLGETGQELRGLVRRLLAYDQEDRPSASETERLLWRLRDETGPPRLSEWAPVGVKKAQELARTKLPGDEITGDVLTEQSQTMMLRDEDSGAPSGSTAVPPPSLAPWLAAGGLLLILLGLLGILGLAGVVGVGAMGLDGWLGTDEVAVAAPEPQPEPEPEPEPVPEPPEAPAEPEPGPPPVEAPAPAPRPAPAPARPAPTAAPEPMPDAPSTTQGTVAVDGAGVVVKLAGDNGTFGPGRVPVGRYQVSAQFGDTEVDVGTLIVLANRTHTIRCVGAMRLCRLP